MDVLEFEVDLKHDAGMCARVQIPDFVVVGTEVHLVRVTSCIVIVHIVFAISAMGMFRPSGHVEFAQRPTRSDHMRRYPYAGARDWGHVPGIG